MRIGEVHALLSYEGETPDGSVANLRRRSGQVQTTAWRDDSGWPR
jgi:hypothetical protein